MELDQKTGAGELVKVKCKHCGKDIHHHDWCSFEECLRALSEPEAEQEWIDCEIEHGDMTGATMLERVRIRRVK